MKKQLKHLSDLKASRINPREITVQNLNHLKSSIEEFGDISGIVFNRRTGELVCGHQRVFAMREKYGNLAIKDGRIELPNGESFTIRIVDWDKNEQQAALIAANSPTTQGTFTAGIGSLLNNLERQIPNVYEALGFNSLKPKEITGPQSWSDGHDSESAPWNDSEKAREGKPLSESIANDVKLEARFEFKVPDKLASKTSKLLLNLVKELPGATLRRLD
jgi:hypothetical protein